VFLYVLSSLTGLILSNLAFNCISTIFGLGHANVLGQVVAS
jgi:hypothetical protein